MMKIYLDRDADLGLLKEKQIGVIGYGNQGRAQALNLRDSGLNVIVGNREDHYAEKGRQDSFEVVSVAEAARRSDVLMLLIPDEIMPQVYMEEIATNLEFGKALVYASEYI